MSVFWLIVAGIVAFNLIWWLGAHAWLKAARAAWPWRAALAAFMLLMIGALAWLFVERLVRGAWSIPIPLLAAAYVWHLITLPLGVALILLAAIAAGLSTVRGRQRQRMDAVSPLSPSLSNQPVTPSENPLPKDSPPTGAVLTRRQLLASAVVATPPLLTGVGVVKGLGELDSFRVRRIEVPLAGLPRDLDGATIAHVTDLHVGRYTNGRVLHEVADRVNALRADLVLMTGDLIDHSLADLPAGLDMIAKFDRPVFTCEGNHDLFEGRAAFAQAVRGAGVPLLLNEATELKLRGAPVQILGIRWGSGSGRPGSRGGRGADIDAHMAEIEPLRRPDAFQILLAHHPHAFEVAAAMNFPLTLAGHTHGGQLMLADNIGAGPLLYRYWSGLYSKETADGGNVACVVSNGVGNWFPLRLNAPAEIIHLTLRCA